MGYRAIPRGAWEPTSRDEIPDLGLFRAERSIDRGYLEFARAFRVLFPEFADHFEELFPGEGGKQGQRTAVGQDFFRFVLEHVFGEFPA
eukprot:6079862-Lingulodinium_polyedra.AAC.1